MVFTFVRCRGRLIFKDADGFRRISGRWKALPNVVPVACIRRATRSLRPAVFSHESTRGGLNVVGDSRMFAHAHLPGKFAEHKVVVASEV